MHFEVRHRTRILKLVFLSCKHTVSHKIYSCPRLLTSRRDLRAPLYILHLEFHIKGRRKRYRVLELSLLGRPWAGAGGGGGGGSVCPRRPPAVLCVLLFLSCQRRPVSSSLSDHIYIFL